jgi:anti-sigma regulatory factor (Ser/Thr protein kinase)
MSTTETHHGLFVYDTDETFAGRAERYLLNGLERGRAVLAVTCAAKQELLHDTLGSAAKRIAFANPADVYARPETALARYDQLIRRSLHTGGPDFSVYGEFPPFDTQAEWDRWMAYEAILNRAFAGRPVEIMCGYDARAVPGAAMQRAWQCHRDVLTNEWQESPHYREPPDLVRDLTPVPEQLRGLTSLRIGKPRDVRERLAGELSTAGVAADRAGGLVLATGEALSNAERYGNGVRLLRTGRVGESFVCEVCDRGTGFDDPLAGYLPPRSGGSGGAGLWVARQLTERLELFCEPGGFTVRLWI